jgi:transcriptional regulator with XRE-family HTH domain
MKTFGEYIFDLRRQKRITLREFCRVTKVDPSNWSKIERGILQPPKSNQVLEEIAAVLGLQKGSEEFNLLFDLAAIAFIPRNLVLQEEKMLGKLPIFFRTLRGNKPTEEELETIIKLLKEE